MHRRSVIAFVLSLSLFSIQTLAADVEMYGISIYKNDYIGAGLISARGTTAILDIGYLHGVTAGNRFWVFRDRGQGHQRICDLKIIRADRQTSVGRATLKIELQPGDRFVIKASVLDLWTGRTRKEEELLTRLTFRQATGRYDTRDTQTNSFELLERPWKSSLRFREWSEFIRDVRQSKRAYIDLKTLREQLRNRLSIDPLEYQLGKFINNFTVKLETTPPTSTGKTSPELPAIVKPALDRLKQIREELKGQRFDDQEKTDEKKPV